MSVLIVLIVLIASISCMLAANFNESEHQGSTTRTEFSRRPSISSMKGLPGLESVLGVMGPLALAAMVSLPFVAPAAAALLPLASLSNMFGRRRRNLDDPRDSFPEAEALLRRIHAAAIRRNGY
ncbi:uncharacterized protein TNIN_237091 [Trichonephila inaurata madagascariensis]|uniref:Uncharacterized protein n=1 Tax=Trichonephila inaurata madagascariensis TaxID=2747483 RepID=A0A8X7CCM3_9ARAC|nr:uncharacterized protein TNIN_462411 [Trichonephila inaurata madagascariensis]GFY61806.1 uncharacterized protein TNIN_237091 [Trichonephila inaurata madagascariensis]